MTVFAIGLAYLSNPVSPYISSLFIRPHRRTKVFVVAISIAYSERDVFHCTSLNRARKHHCTAINPNSQKLANTENIAVQFPSVLLAATSQSTFV